MRSRAGAPPSSRRIYLRGLGSQVGKGLGSFVYRSPVLRRRKKLTQQQTYSAQTMAVAARFVSLATAWEYQTAKDLAGQSGYTWKDMLISSFFGTAIEFTDVNGVRWEGRRILASDIQQLLDSISAVPGGMLVRTPAGWAVLYIGSPGYSLIVDPATNLPTWAAPASASTGSDLIAVPTGATPTLNSTSSATIGQFFIPQVDTRIKAITPTIGPTTTPRTYRCYIANIDNAGKILSVAALSPDTWTTSATGGQSFTFTFPSAPTLAKGSLYAFCLVRTDATATSPGNIYLFSSNGNAPIPALPADYGAMLTTYGNISRIAWWNTVSTTPSNVAASALSNTNLLFETRASI